MLIRSFAVSLLLLGVSSCATTKTATGTVDDSAVSERIKHSKKGNEKVTEYDIDGDKKPDIWAYTVADKTPEGKPYDRLVLKELDLNHDGRIDVRRQYDEKELMSKESMDLDFDGKIDQVNFYEKGQLVRKESDVAQSGKVSLWAFYEKGHLARKERDSNGDGRADYWEYWEGDKIDRIGEDIDGDGNVDKWTKNPDSNEK